jgi:hypothetical protein
MSDAKVCPNCNKTKPISEYYIHIAGKPEKVCKKCKIELQKLRYKYSVKESGVPHEQEVINMLKRNGIYACSGKMSRARWVDVVAWGCVAIECKLARVQVNSAGSKTLNWAVTLKQQREGIRGDIVMLLVNNDHGFDFHLFRADYEYFYRGGKLISPTITYTNRTRKKAHVAEWVRTFESVKNQLGLIEAIRSEKMRDMINGKNVDNWVE